jgi:hypothetical protein
MNRRGGEPGDSARAAPLDKLTIDETVVVKAPAPAGSHHRGYEGAVVQDFNLRPQATRYRRERWKRPDGEAIVAELDPGIVVAKRMIWRFYRR